ncbi:MAG: transcription antitermination factor NusB [Endomicrobia bacterium]|nr:transcription antitermination factor NusB [Endomicrobiia bacterium]
MVAKKKKSILGLRRKARILALNVLYLIDVGSISVDTGINSIFGLHNNFPESVKKFSSFLVIATIQNLNLIDEIITKYLQNWTLQRLSAVDRNILRIATCEFLCCYETPVSVIINEAIEIAKSYSTKDSGRFVNGVLDKVKSIRENKKLVNKFIEPENAKEYKQLINKEYETKNFRED